jgi:hypothetical protein
MNKAIIKKTILFVLWAVLMVWIVARTPTASVAKGKLSVMVSDLDDLFKSATLLSRHENAKTGAALALYEVDASTWSKEKSDHLKKHLEAKGWVPAHEQDYAYVMCKGGMKASISKSADESVIRGLRRYIFSVSMEFNAGTEDFCRREVAH